MQMGKIQDRMREFMTKLSKDGASAPPSTPRSRRPAVSEERKKAEEQKEKALARLKNRKVLRPGKKDSKYNKPDGKYVKPEVGLDKNQVNPRIIPEKEPVPPAPLSENEIPVSKAEDEQKKLGLASLVKRLRGVSQLRKNKGESERASFPRPVTAPEEDSSGITDDSADELKNFYSDASDDFVVNPPDEKAPDETVATALSVAVGIIYWDDMDRLVDRVVTIRRLFRRQGDILIDAFCHDLSAPRLIFFSRVVRLYDLKTFQTYEDPREFLLYSVAGVSRGGGRREDAFVAALSEVRYDLAALAFVARADSEKSDAENRLIFEYVKERCAHIPFDEKEMFSYISMLYPDEQSFYEAVDVIVKQSHNVLYPFVETFLQLILSDGVIHDNERELLAELLYILRLEGIELNILGLK